MQKDLTNYELLEILDERIDQKLDQKLDEKLGGFEARMNERFDQMVDITGKQFLIHGEKIDALDRKIDDVELRLTRRIDHVEISLTQRIDRVESSLKSEIRDANGRIDWVTDKLRKLKIA